MNAPRSALALLGVLTFGACTVQHPAAVSTSDGDTAVIGSPAQLLAAVQRDADQIDAARDGAQRAQLVAAAAASASQCLSQAPQSAVCHYAQAQAQGLSARERPLQAGAILKQMLASLARAEALDAALDHAGPARLSAVVLMRAPPWPLGPGDAESAVSAAQRAVQRDPAYPPNLITLAQAQAKSGGAPLARSTYARARLAAQAWPGAAQQPDVARWQGDIDQGLHDLQ